MCKKKNNDKSDMKSHKVSKRKLLMQNQPGALYFNAKGFIVCKC